MSEYSPPNWIEPLSIYNPINFRPPQITNGGGSGGSGFLNFPVAQGSQTMKNTLINGSLSVSASQSVNMGANVVQNAGTPINPTDLATKAYVDLNAGTQNLQSVLTAGNTTGNFQINHSNNYGDIYNASGANWVVACDPVQFTPIATNDLYLASNATDNFVRFGSYSGSTFTETARIGDLATGEKRAIFAGTLNAVSIEDATGSKGTNNQYLTAGSGGSLVWASGGGGGSQTLDQVLSHGNTATGSYATINLTDTDTGGSLNPILTLNNTNATGSVALEVYKNKPTAPANGDVLFNQSVYGKDASGNKQEYTRTTHTIRDRTTGGEDGSMEFLCFVNGAVSTFLQLNGLENEINISKTLDLGGNAIRTTSGDMIISTAPSSTTGNLTITAKTDLTLNSNAGDIDMSGNNIVVQSQTETHSALTISRNNTNQIYRSTYQPLLTTTPVALPVAEFVAEGQQVILVNSKGDGGNEMTILSTPNFTITQFEYVSTISRFVAGGWNHIDNRPEIRCASSINALYQPLTTFTGSYIAFDAATNPSGYIFTLCYDPVLFPDTIGVGGFFTATTSNFYNATQQFPSDVQNFLCINVATSNIAPLDMMDAGSSPYTNIFGANNVVKAVATYSGSHFGASGNWFIIGGSFTELVSNGGTNLVAQSAALYSPTGSFTPLNLRWIIMFEANNTINGIITFGANVICGGDFTTIGLGGVGGTPYASWTNNLNSPSFQALGDTSGTPFSPTTACETMSRAITNVAGVNEGYMAFKLVSGSPNTYPVYNILIDNISASSPTLYKQDFPAGITGFGVDTLATPMKLNFITGWTFNPSGSPLNSFVWEVQTPHYIDLNGAISMGNINYDVSVSPRTPYFCMYPTIADATPFQIAFYAEVGATPVVITTTTALPFVNALAPNNKYTQVSLGEFNNFVWGTIIGFGTDDVRILILSQVGATFSN